MSGNMQGMLAGPLLGHSSFLGRRPLLATPSPRPTQSCTRIMAGDIGPGKKWEHYPLNKNGKPIRQPMPMYTGDTVQVIAGSDRNKVGEIISVIPKTGQVVVAGINIKVRYVKPKAEGETGQITERESPIHHSNVMLYSKQNKTRSRIGYRVKENGTKVRYFKKTGEELPSSKDVKPNKQ